MRACLSKVPTLIAGAALALLAACGPDAGDVPVSNIPPTPPKPVAVPGQVDPSQPVQIAFLAPLTTPNERMARLGQALVNAGQMAAADLGDPLIGVQVYDTGGDPVRAGQAAAQAAAAGADLIVGPLLSQSTLEVAAVAEPAGLKVISFSTDTNVAGDPVYLSGFLPEWEAERIVSYAASQGRAKLAVFASATAAGDAALRGVQNSASRSGAWVVAQAQYGLSFEGIQAAAEDFADDARANGADALLLPSGGVELQSAGSFTNYHGLDPRNVQYLGLGQWNSRASFQEPALQAGWFPAPDPALSTGFASRYQARYGDRPPILAALGYDAVWIAGDMLNAARQAGSVDAFAASAIARPQGFQGVLGPLRFTPEGYNQRAMAILEVGRRSFQVRDPAPRGIGPGT